METLVTDSPAHAATFVASGSVVAFPTETVYGLGAPAFSPSAIRKIFEAKGRPADNPIIVHIARTDDFERAGVITNSYTPLLIEAFFPGPLTVVVQRSPDVPDEVTAGLDTVGIRMPDHPIGRAFLLACDTPLAAPSANLSGRPSPTTWSAVYDDLNGRIPCILNGGRSRVGLESTVVDCTGEKPVILRLGAVSLEAIRHVEPTCTTLEDDIDPISAASPGLLHRHYAPDAIVIVVDDIAGVHVDNMSAYIGLDSLHSSSTPGIAAICPDVENYAHMLFAFFRDCEHRGIQKIYCQEPPSNGLGQALRDRLRRAEQATAHPRV